MGRMGFHEGPGLRRALRLCVLASICALGPATAQGPARAARSPYLWREWSQAAFGNNHAWAYDPVRDRVVLFGGLIGDRPSNETWEWDGKRWERRRTAPAPAPRTSHGMAFDPVRKRILLFGGWDIVVDPRKRRWYGDTWEWDGRDWRQLRPAASPSPRRMVGLATDWTRNRIVLFGGLGEFSLSSETWEWDGSTWRLRTPRTVPAARLGRSLAFDPNRRRVAMIGGRIGIRDLPLDVWEWDGNDWARIGPANGPTPRQGYGLATDTAGGGVIVVGGYDQNMPILLRDCWRWDGRSWQVLPSIPDWVSSIAVGDFQRREVLALVPRGDATTYAWDGKRWRAADVARFPVVIGSIVHDARRDRVLVVAPDDRSVQSKPLATWWAHEDGRFEKLSPKHSPPGRLGPGVVYHAALDRVLLYGGAGWLRHDTWVFDGADWTQHVSAQYPPLGVRPAQLTYDSNTARILCAVQKDLWAWDQKGWKRLARGQAYAAAVAYDPLRKRTVMVGATLQQEGTWEWDGQKWTNKRPGTQPSIQFRQLEYMPGLQGVVMFGGQDGALRPFTDTWVWRGRDWERLDTTPLSTRGAFRSSTYDSARQRILCTWSGNSRIVAFLDASLATTQPHPRPGESFAADIDMPDLGGRLFLLALSAGTHPGIPLRNLPGVGTEVLPLAPDPLLSASFRAGLARALDRGGRGRIPLRIPAGPAWVWFRFHMAGIALGRGAGVERISNRVPIQVVR